MADFKQNYFQRRTKDRGPRSNNRISSPEVQVIGSDGENLGILNTNDAISKAKNQGLNFVSTIGCVNIFVSLQYYLYGYYLIIKEVQGDQLLENQEKKDSLHLKKK